jgi:hypothetical protein
MKFDDHTRALWDEVREADRHRRNFEQLTRQVSALASRVDDALAFPADYDELQFRLPISEQVTSLIQRAKQLVSEFEVEEKRIEQQFHDVVWRFLEVGSGLRRDDRICCSDWKGRPITVVPHNFWVGDKGVGDLVFWCTIVRKDGTVGKRDHSFHLEKDSWTKKPTERLTGPEVQLDHPLSA